ncbi:MAG: tetratricopeptide repeat protein [Verrucomicrobiae bacterium]|nr:tetratricopeptide repeat protein [Verrucomicrobiae bacterium]
MNAFALNLFLFVACSKPTTTPPASESTNTFTTNLFQATSSLLSEPSALSYYVQGICAEAQNDPQAAFHYYQLAFAKDPSFTELGKLIIEQSLAMQKPDQALPVLQQFIQKEPNNSTLYSQQGLAYFLLKKKELAQKSLEKAITLNTTNYQAYALLYQTLEETHAPDQNQGITAIQKKAPKQSTQSKFWVNTGEAYANLLTDNETAKFTTAQIAQKTLPLFQHALDLSPNNLALIIRLAEIQTLCTNYSQAITLYQKAIRLSPKNEMLQSRLAVVYLNTDQKNKAISIIENLSRKHPDNGQFFIALAKLYGQQNNPSKMQTYLDLAETKGIEPALLAEVATQNRDWSLSEKYLKKAILKPGADFNVWIQLTEALAEQNKLSEALAIMKKAQLQFPSTPEIFLISSLIARQNKQTKLAQDFLQQTEQIITNSTESTYPLDELYYQWGVFYEQTGDLEKSEKSFQKSISLNPKNHKAMNYLSYQWADHNTKLDQALELVKKALTHEPENPAYLDTLGWIYYQQKKYQDALPIIEKAFKKSNFDAEIGEHLGDIHLKLNHTSEALKAWEKAIQNDPKRESLRKKIKNYSR